MKLIFSCIPFLTPNPFPNYLRWRQCPVKIPSQAGVLELSRRLSAKDSFEGDKTFMFKKLVLILALVFATIAPRLALALETVTAALTSKAFQYVPLVIAQERGYMREEGLDLKLVFMQNAAGLQALIANQVQFSGSGSSALVAISKGNAPLKTVLAFNDQVLQWIVARPNIKTLRDLSGKKVATTGVASIAAYMLRNILIKRNIPKDIVLIDPGPVNRLPALL
jgi:ABC-type nitrate/sulfonate/bicarbonate transport system substrate-binding protein